MAKLYGKIGSLAQLLSILNANGIHDFETMSDIRSFRNNYKNTLKKNREKCKNALRKEIINLESIHEKHSTEISLLKGELQELCAQSDEKRFALIKHFIRKIKTLSKKKKLEHSIAKKNKILLHLKNDIDDKINNPDRWIEQYASNEAQRQEIMIAVFKENRHLFYGAEGEEKVVLELSKLPDTYTVINDCRLNFDSPIYDRKNDDRIYSIQIDHIVVGPSGIYLIETKNWSKDSIENIDLFSPIRQLERHNFAMFVLLNQAIKKGRVKYFSDHWGDRKISPKNIVCMINEKPQREFQYVKILSLREIVRFISYGKQMYNESEVEGLTDYVLKMSAMNMLMSHRTSQGRRE